MGVHGKGYQRDWEMKELKTSLTNTENIFVVVWKIYVWQVVLSQDKGCRSLDHENFVEEGYIS